MAILTIAPLCGTCWRDGRTCRCIFTKATLPTGFPAALTCCFPGSTEKNQRYYGEGDCLKLGGLTIRVLETPGHSRGSVCLVAGDVIFSGDTLFYGSCGRTDFAGGSYEDILRSLKRLAQLPGQYKVYPGHDQPTTLDYERRANPYVRQGMK